MVNHYRSAQRGQPQKTGTHRGTYTNVLISCRYLSIISREENCKEKGDITAFSDYIQIICVLCIIGCNNRDFPTIVL